MPPLIDAMVHTLTVVCGSALAMFLVLALVFGALRMVDGFEPHDPD